MTGTAEQAAIDVTSVYLPNHCLQGEEVPAHVLWTGEAGVRIRIRFPPELQLKQVFNAAAVRGNNIKAGTLSVSRFDVPGYLGLVFQAKRVESPSLLVSVKFEIADRSGTVLRESERKVALFRPLVRKIDVPLGSKVILTENGRGVLENRIALANSGDGTALIRVDVTRDGMNALSAPSGVEQFVSNYKADVAAEFGKAKGDFPRWRRLLDWLAEIQQRPIEFEKKAQRRDKVAFRELSKAAEADRAFIERVQAILIGAYFRNLKFVTEVNSLLDYLNSIGSGRVVISNALDVVRLNAGTSTLSLKVSVADVALKRYPPVDLGTFIIETDFSAEIPVHCLFSWRLATSGLEQRLAA